MAKGTSLYLSKVVNTGSVKLTITDTTVAVAVFTAGSDDSNLKALIACSDDTATVNLAVYVRRSSTDYLIGTTRIVTLSGTDGAAPAVDILNSAAFVGLPIDANGKRYIPLKTGDVIKVGCLATMTTAKTCTVSAFGEDF